MTDERITSAMLAASTLNDLNSTLGALQRSGSELSSGRKILEPSDDPYGASHAIELQSQQLDGLTEYAASVQDGIAWTQTASGALSNMTEVLQRVRELVVEANNGSYGPADLSGIATEVTQLTEAIKQDAETQYAGQYVFSGTDTTTAPYQEGEHDEYKGDTEAITRSLGPGASVTISTNLASVLGSGQRAKDGKLLDVLRTIAQHLGEATPESRAALGSTDLKELDKNMEALTQAAGGRRERHPATPDGFIEDRIAPELRHPGLVGRRERRSGQDVD